MKIRLINYGELIQAGLTPDDADAIQRISRSLHTLDERQCNGFSNWRGDWDEEAEKKAEKREARLEAKGQEIAKRYGRLFYHQGDPRGWSVYLVKPEELRGYDIDAAYNHGLAVCPHY